MAPQLIIMIQSIIGFIAGLAIGLGFGMVQDAARRRNERREREGKTMTGWSIMPGSGVRVAYLLIALVLVQFLCPLLFRDGVQWWVSGGLVAGYGYIRFKQLRERMSKNK